MHTCSDRELALLRTSRGARGRVEWIFDDGVVSGLQKVSMVKMKICLGGFARVQEEIVAFISLRYCHFSLRRKC